MESALAARITGFVATIRANGFAVGLREAEDALKVAEAVGIVSPEPLRFGWRGLLCARADEWNRFDELFDSYWLPPNKRKLVESRGRGAGHTEFGQEIAPNKPGPAIRHGEDAGFAGNDGGTAQGGASAASSLEQADFSSLREPEQTRAIEVLIRRFARRLKLLKTRREQAQATARRPDLRRTLRRGAGSGGLPVRLSYRAPRQVRPRLVLLLDVSRSMSLYSFFYLRVARALAAELPDIYVFLYHTHLTHVTEALSDPDPWRARERLQLLSAGWAGGTRIGECLAAFNRQYAVRLVHARTAIIIASDGYDTGAPGLLGGELTALAAQARRLVWLNPMKAVTGYVPLARGMREALPYIGLFASAHDLASLDAALSGLMEIL